MKRLIVLTVSATLLAFFGGCSIVRQQGAEPCDTTTSLPSKLSRFRLKNILPWKVTPPPACQGCNEGFSDLGYTSGQIIDQGYHSNSYVNAPIVSSDTLYNSDVVYEGPVVEAPTISPSPISFEDLPAGR